MLRHLLATHGKSERNAIFRRNLCLAAFATRLSLLLPLFALWGWGLANIVTVSITRGSVLRPNGHTPLRARPTVALNGG